MADEAVANAVPNNPAPVQPAAPAAEAHAIPKRTVRRPRVPKVATASTTAQSFATNKALLFGKYSYDVDVADLSLKNQINLKPIIYPVSHGRSSQRRFAKANMNIVERLENALMRGGTGSKIGGHVIRTEGRLQGKKIKAAQIVEEAFDIVSKQTGKNPIHLLVRALENSAPIEDTTRVVYGGITSNVAVDVSASRRLDIALRNVAISAIIGAFKNKRTISQALANELVMSSGGDINSYAIKRKNEIERMARSAK